MHPTHFWALPVGQPIPSCYPFVFITRPKRAAVVHKVTSLCLLIHWQISLHCDTTKQEYVNMQIIWDAYYKQYEDIDYIIITFWWDVTPLLWLSLWVSLLPSQALRMYMVCLCQACLHVIKCRMWLPIPLDSVKPCLLHTSGWCYSPRATTNIQRALSTAGSGNWLESLMNEYITFIIKSLMPRLSYIVQVIKCFKV